MVLKMFPAIGSSSHTVMMHVMVQEQLCRSFHPVEHCCPFVASITEKRATRKSIPSLLLFCEVFFWQEKSFFDGVAGPCMWRCPTIVHVYIKVERKML